LQLEGRFKLFNLKVLMSLSLDLIYHLNGKYHNLVREIAPCKSLKGRGGSILCLIFGLPDILSVVQTVKNLVLCNPKIPALGYFWCPEDGNLPSVQRPSLALKKIIYPCQFSIKIPHDKF
jgi:hypothetical protein